MLAAPVSLISRDLQGLKALAALLGCSLMTQMASGRAGEALTRCMSPDHSSMHMPRDTMADLARIALVAG